MAGAASTPSAPFDIVGTPVCIVSNLLVGFAVLWSPFGSVFFMDDSFGAMSVVAPVLAGLVLGLLQSSMFGPRVTLMAVLLPMVPLVLSVIFAFAAVAQAAGIGAACGITSALNHRGTGRDHFDR